MESESEVLKRFHFCLHRLRSSYDLVKPDCQSWKQKWRDKPQCTFARFVIGLVLLLLLATPTTQFSLDRKQQSH